VSVRAAVRSAEKGEALKRAYPQFSDNLETVVVPDIEKSGAYDDVVQGADIVIHMASPLPRPGLDNEAGILIPAREGIVNMLKAAKGAPSVQRVVMTSSSVAVMDFSVPRTDTYHLCFQGELMSGESGLKKTGILRHGKMASAELPAMPTVFQKPMPKGQHGSLWERRNLISISLH